jgi:hypothetical protein
MNNFSNISVRDLKKAITIKTRLKSLQAKLDGILGGSGPASMPKRGMSAAGRKRIALAQKKRWAKQKGKSSKKGRKKMSAAGRAKIAAAARERWAKVKAAGKSRL